jgi:hypothetical protein
MNRNAMSAHPVADAMETTETPRRSGAWGWVVHEFKRFLLIFSYLFVVLMVFELNQAVALAQHGISIRAQGFALINAFVMGKVVMIGEGFNLGSNFKDRPLIYPILHKALLFTFLLLGFHIAEKVIGGVINGRTVIDSIPAIGGGTVTGVVSVVTLVFVLLIPFFSFREFGRVIGEPQLWALLFRRGAAFEVQSRLGKLREGAKAQ